MSLCVFSEPKNKPVNLAVDLQLGTWFLDHDNQVFVVVLDDRTNEKRILCSGNLYQPFIANISANEFSVKRVLPIGTLLQISNFEREGARNVNI